MSIARATLLDLEGPPIEWLVIWKIRHSGFAAAKSAFEISAARQRRGNELNTMRAHARSFSPDVSM